MIVNTLYGFKLDTDYSVEWLAVAERPEDGLILLVPCDDTPMVSKCDVPIRSARPARQSPMFARCGVATWVTTEDITRNQPIRFGVADAAETILVRRTVAGLARGIVPEGETATDNDPEYWRLTAELESLGLMLSGGRLV